MVATPAETPLRPAREPGGIFTGIALVAALVALAGFARTYYLKVAFGTPELSGLKHLHGLVMTAWLILLVTQVRLVATGRTAIHRKLGVAGAVLAAMLVFVGADLAITSAREGFTPAPGLSPLVFLVMPLGEAVTFTVLVTAAILYRRRPAIHKRLMIVATLAMLTPAIARIAMQSGLPPIPPVFFAMTDMLIIGAMAWDWTRNHRLHPAFIAGLATVLVVQVGRLVLSQTEAWMRFAGWLAA